MGHALQDRLLVRARRALAGRYGAEAMVEAGARILDMSEAAMRSAIARMPDGTYEFEDFLDDDGVDLGKPIKLHVALTVAGDRITVDLSGCSPQARGPVNATLASSNAAVPAGAATGGAGGGVLVAEPDGWEDTLASETDSDVLVNRLPKADPPPLPEPPPARTMREIVRLTLNDPRYGLAAVGLFAILVMLGTFDWRRHAERDADAIEGRSGPA